MYSLKNIYHETYQILGAAYGPDECRELALLLVGFLSGCTKAEILAGKSVKNFDQQTLNSYTQRLLAFEPVQYILGFTYFYGLRFEVNPDVFIPRPETEELVDLIIKTHANDTTCTLLDIGTGSGCISVTLAHYMPKAHVYALEISQKALDIARLNAKNNQVNVQFICHDIDREYTANALPMFDIIVSNPPYIATAEAPELQANVVDYEPHLALFSKSGDPIHFYKSITQFSLKYLKHKGCIYFEINRLFGSEVAKHLHEFGFKNIRIVKDINNNDRFVTGIYE